MSKKIALLFGVHAHQPVGNFREVLDDAHLRCYQPFLHLVERFPEFHFSIHVSGWLLDYLLKHYPDDLQLLKTMVSRGQAEMFCAGYSEPVLAAIPVRDRVGQINLMAARIEQLFGRRPKGAWLTERVWDSSVVPSLAACDVQYVTVDDYHFLCTGKEAGELTGFFSTEEDGKRVDIFPISEALRYRLPFSPAREAVEYLESLAVQDKDQAVIYFDDIEKFGIWPETYEWVYTKGWLEEFMRRVLDSEIIRPMRHEDYHAGSRTRGVVYLPTTSYVEMNEWTLPAEASSRYAHMVAEAKSSGEYESRKPFLRGGIWRNFFSRYPESNWMHKRMLSLSARLSALSDGKRTVQMRDILYEAQANDAYWHGLFGGLYLPHLRRAVYSALIRLEGLLDGVASRPEIQSLDLDLDGHAEHFLQNGILQVAIGGEGHADIREFDHYRLLHNFADTLTRQHEHYHHKVVLNQASAHHGPGIANPHDQVSFKHKISQEDMIVDSFRRSLFVDRFFLEGKPEMARYDPVPSPGGGPSIRFHGFGPDCELNKRITLERNVLKVRYDFLKSSAADFEIELNLAMPSCDGPAGRFELHGEVPGGFAQPLVSQSMDELFLIDDVLGGRLKLTLNPPGWVRSSPCFSVSQSEAGFEKIMQAVTIQIRWPAKLLDSPIEIRLAVDS